MTRVFAPDGDEIPVSVVEAGPCVVIRKKTIEKDGYEALQVGFGERRKNLFGKPEAGVFEKAGQAPRRHLREIRGDSAVEIGQEIKATIFKPGERVDVTGISRGLGFQGVIKRHHFGGGPMSHGQSDRARAVGSIGSSSYPSRVYKGMRAAGKMGRDKVTILNLEVIQVIDSENLILVRGAVPGKKGTLLKIRQTNRRK